MILSKFNSVSDFYKTLRDSLTSKPEKDRPKITKPSNVKELAKIIDEDQSSFRHSLVTMYSLLIFNYRSRLTHNRQRSLQRANLKRKHDYDSKKSTNRDDNNAESVKTNRLECLPDFIYNFESHQAKVSVIMYLLQSYPESIKKSLILAILNGHMDNKSVGDLVNLCAKSVSEIRKTIKGYNTDSNETQRKMLIKALIELSEILKDKQCSKLAMEISSSCYITLLKEYLRREILFTIAPFDALISKYVKECIPLHKQDLQRGVIINQFKMNIASTIGNIIENLPPPSSNKVSSSSSSNSSHNKVNTSSFNASQVYQVYRGAPNYVRDIVTTYYDHEGKRYKILTYTDCLYDVIGYVYESTDSKGEKVVVESRLFDRDTWLERLEKIPYRTKVIVNKMKGQELNEFNSNADVTVSWMNEHGLAMTKTYAFKKRDKKPVD